MYFLIIRSCWARLSSELFNMVWITRQRKSLRKPYPIQWFLETNSEPDIDDTFVMRSSMGGLISMHTLALHGDVFGGLVVCLRLCHWPLMMTYSSKRNGRLKWNKHGQVVCPTCSLRQARIDSGSICSEVGLQDSGWSHGYPFLDWVHVCSFCYRFLRCRKGLARGYVRMLSSAFLCVGSRSVHRNIM